MRRLVIGGARSGKSRYAEGMLRDAGVVDYVATSARRPEDAEWGARVAAHVGRRPAAWRTVETLDLPSVLGRQDPAPVLIDCLTVWLSRVLDECGAWPELPGYSEDAAERLHVRVDELVEAVRSTGRDVTFVTNEVGQGVVPASLSGRLFRDEMGILNARVADACDEAWLLVAGLPVRLK
ncbi:MAG: bifunctional adenosylcobinamide kinase/adenosylcobinamide-phosphate guanylyltransferase [Propionibacteriaceae bacterium]